jgi:hypothetical protein
VLSSDEFVEKLLESDGSALSDTDESSNTDCGDQEVNALLLDGSASGLGGSACVTNTYVLWEGMLHISKFLLDVSRQCQGSDWHCGYTSI